MNNTPQPSEQILDIDPVLKTARLEKNKLLFLVHEQLAQGYLDPELRKLMLNHAQRYGSWPFSNPSCAFPVTSEDLENGQIPLSKSTTSPQAKVQVVQQTIDIAAKSKQYLAESAILRNGFVRVSESETRTIVDPEHSTNVSMGFVTENEGNSAVGATITQRASRISGATRSSFADVSDGTSTLMSDVATMHV